MNSILKRVLSLTGSAALGLTAAVAFASAAQADESVIDNDVPQCVTGAWEINWTLTVDAPSADATGEVLETDQSGMLTGALQVGAPVADGTVLTGTQTQPGTDNNVWLEVTLFWDNDADGEYDEGTDTVETVRSLPILIIESCETAEEGGDGPTAPIYDAQSDCFGMQVGARHADTAAEHEVTLTPSQGEAFSRTVDYRHPVLQYFPALNPDEPLTVTITIDGEEIGVVTWDADAPCTWGSYEQTCEGLTFELAVPDGAVPLGYMFTVGDETRSEALEGGESMTVEFPAEGGELEVSFAIRGGHSWLAGSVSWAMPDDCDEESPAPSDSPSDSPSESSTPEAKLPVTGSPMTVMIGVAAAAIVIGAAALIVLARRRRLAAD